MTSPLPGKCVECGRTGDHKLGCSHRDGRAAVVHMTGPLPTDEDREALAQIIGTAESLTDDEGAWALPEDIADAILAAGFRRSVVSTPGDAREAVLTSLRRSHVGEMVSKIPEAHRRMVAEGIFDALSAVSAPPTITDEATAITLSARRGGKSQTLIDAMLAQANERGIAVTIVPPQVTDETVHQALLTYYPEGSENESIRDWPVVLVRQMRAALVAALGGEEKTHE